MLGIHPADLDMVLLSHLDCDHASGLKLVADAKQILVSKDELLYADGGYAGKSRERLITSGIADDRAAQKKSLGWIRKQSLSEKCVASLANHDPDVHPQIIEF